MSTFCWWPLRKSESSYKAWSGLGQIQIHTFVFVPKCKFASIRLSLRQSLRIQIDLNFPTHLLYLFLTKKNLLKCANLTTFDVKHMWQNSGFMPNSWSGGIHSEVANVITRMAIQKRIFLIFTFNLLLVRREGDKKTWQLLDDRLEIFDRN